MFNLKIPIKKCKPVYSRLLCLFLVFILFSSCFSFQNNNENADKNAEDSKDPFHSIGIPELNPKKLLEEMDEDKNKERLEAMKEQHLRTIDDLPRFLKYTKLDEITAKNQISRFLLQDDETLKGFGAIYDESGFDGVKGENPVSVLDIEKRSEQRARSSAMLYVIFKIILV